MTQIEGLQKTISSLRGQKRRLTDEVEALRAMLKTITKVSPVARAIANTDSYSGGHYDTLNMASKVLTAMSWGDYPAKSYDALIDRLSDIDVRFDGETSVTYFVLWDDTTCASGWYQDGLQIDTEEWYQDVDKDLISELKEDDTVWDQVQDAIADFANAIAAEVLPLMENAGIDEADLDAITQIETA